MKYASDQIDLGVLGGMGPRATNYFVGALLDAVEVRHRPMRDQEYPNLAVRYACYLPDRMAAIEKNLEPLTEGLRNEAQLLVDIGCPRIVVPCVSVHAAMDRLPQFPFVKIPEAVAAHIRRDFPKSRVGVLATRGARLAGIVDKFAPLGEPVVVLKAGPEAELMSFIFNEAKGPQVVTDTSKLMELASLLRDEGCNVIVAACTEVEMCLASHQAGDLNGIILPLQIVARDFSNQWAPRHR